MAEFTNKEDYLAAVEANRKIILSGLNDRQSQAVSSGSFSTLVLAGAGSGKTSVLTKRIAYLINEGFDPESILAVTFTNKAADEMKKRLRKIIGREAVEQVWMGTFHSLCNKILRTEYEAAGLQKNFAILDVDGQEIVVRNILKDIVNSGVHDALDSEDEKKKTPSSIVKWINSKKEDGISPYEIDATSDNEIEIECFQEYQRVCAAQGLLDFSDLLYKCVNLLETKAEIREKYRLLFKSILVDEFQDTNDIQYRWLHLIKDPGSFVMAVGDDDQSIYGFRGANPENMNRFVREMATVDGVPSIIKLEQNYRSLPYILESANAVIDRNINRLGKKLWSSSPDNNEKIHYMEYQNGFSEAASTAKSIHALIKNGVSPSEIAVLYRSNAQSRGLEGELNKLAVPTTVYGGYRFYDRQEVKLVLSYVDLIANFDRDVSFAKVVNFPKRGLGETTIEELRQQAREAGVSMVKKIIDNSELPEMKTGKGRGKQAALESFVESIFSLAEESESLPLSGLMEAVIEKMGIKTHYEAQDDAEERMSNLGELVSAARQFEIENPELKTASVALPEYLSFVTLLTSSSESDINKKKTVSLMTVHAAKGLEFDSVFVIGLEEGTFPSSHALNEEADFGNGKSFDDAYADVGDDFDENGDPEVEDVQHGGAAQLIQEERRLMYVAITRARKQLYLSGVKKRLQFGEEKQMSPSRFIAEIPRQRIEMKYEPKHENGWSGNKFPNGKTSAIISKNNKENQRSSDVPFIAPAIASTSTSPTVNRSNLFKRR